MLLTNRSYLVALKSWYLHYFFASALLILPVLLWHLHFLSRYIYGIFSLFTFTTCSFWKGVQALCISKSHNMTWPDSWYKRSCHNEWILATIRLHNQKSWTYWSWSPACNISDLFLPRHMFFGRHCNKHTLEFPVYHHEIEWAKYLYDQMQAVVLQVLYQGLKMNHY